MRDVRLGLVLLGLDLGELLLLRGLEVLEGGLLRLEVGLLGLELRLLGLERGLLGLELVLQGLDVVDHLLVRLGDLVEVVDVRRELLERGGREDEIENALVAGLVSAGHAVAELRLLCLDVSLLLVDLALLGVDLTLLGLDVGLLLVDLALRGVDLVDGGVERCVEGGVLLTDFVELRLRRIVLRLSGVELLLGRLGAGDRGKRRRDNSGTDEKSQRVAAGNASRRESAVTLYDVMIS